MGIVQFTKSSLRTKSFVQDEVSFDTTLATTVSPTAIAVLFKDSESVAWALVTKPKNINKIKILFISNSPLQNYIIFKIRPYRRFKNPDFTEVSSISNSFIQYIKLKINTNKRGVPKPGRLS
jgi:hypothetical protein